MSGSWLEAILRCPRCGDNLDIGESEARCVNHHTWRSKDGVLSFAPEDNYARSFGFQWTRFNRLQMDSKERRESEETLRRKTGLTPDDVRGKVVLDAGCGMGRFTDVLARWGAGGVVGVDLSEAVLAARQNVRSEKASFIRADLRSLPLRSGSFDVIISLGVLHHTPSTRDSFNRLLPSLKPGGTIAIWVYDRRMNVTHAGSRLIRPITRRMDSQRLLSVVEAAVPRLHAVKQRLPTSAHRAVNMLLPCSEHPDPEWRVLNTYDWYSPTYQWKHTYPEVEQWLEDAGLIKIERLPFPIAVRGQAPS